MKYENDKGKAKIKQEDGEELCAEEKKLNKKKTTERWKEGRRKENDVERSVKYNKNIT